MRYKFGQGAAMKFLRGFCLAGLPLLSFAASPDIALRDAHGRSRNVNEYIGQGQWTVVAIWSVDCVICQREIPEISFFHNEHRKKDATVLGVAVDGAAERARVNRFIELHGIDFPNLIGERADVVKFGGGPLLGTPTYLFFSPAGEFVARRVGATGMDEIERMIKAAR